MVITTMRKKDFKDIGHRENFPIIDSESEQLLLAGRTCTRSTKSQKTQREIDRYKRVIHEGVSAEDAAKESGCSTPAMLKSIYWMRQILVSLRNQYTPAIVTPVLILLLLVSPAMAVEDASTQPKKETRIERFSGRCQQWADDHPKTWKACKFTSKAGLFVLNCAAAVGNIIRWGA